MHVPHLYLPGEVVTLTLAGVRVMPRPSGVSGVRLAYTGPGTDAVGDGRLVASVDLAYPDASTVSIARVLPVDGMPRPGEIWADAAGREYHVRAYGNSIVLSDDGAGDSRHGTSSTNWAWLTVHQQRGPMRRLYRPSTGGA